MDRGIKIVSGGTDNHLMLVDLTNYDLTGKAVEKLLDSVNITCNKNTIPNDPKSPFVTSGVRLGTPAVTSRGLNTADMDQIAEAIAMITQTRGRPVPPPAEYQVDELIAASIESSPVPIQISDSLPDGIQAQYVPKNRTIYVRNGMDAGTTLCAIVRECAQADFHKDYTYNRQAYAAPSYCAAYMVAHRYGLDTAAFNFDRVVALYGNLGKEQQRGFLSDVNTVGGGLLRSLHCCTAWKRKDS